MFMSANKSNRFLALILDLFILSFLETAVIGCIVTSEIDYIKVTSIMVQCLYFILVLTKDLLFKNQSIGKKIFGIEIVDLKTRKSPKIWQLLVRNIFIIPLLIIEMLMVLFSDRRIGDIVCDTVVLKKQK